MSTNQPLFLVSKRALWTYRIVGSIIAVLIASIPWLIPSETAIDPLWQRFSLAGIILGVSLGNIFIPFLRKNILFFVYGYTVLMNAWLIQLAFLNNLSLDYSPTVFIAIAASATVFRHFKLFIANLFVLFLFSVVLFWLPDDPLFSPIYFYMILFIVMLGLGFLMEKQIRERQDLTEGNKKQRLITQSAFEYSEDGILVTDPEGYVLEFNQRFLELWAMTPGDLAGENKKTGMEQAREMVQDPKSLDECTHESLSFPDKLIFQELHLHDGRFIERFSKPLYLEGNHIGRLWFYRDLTQRIRDEKALKASETKYKAVVNAAPDLMFRMDVMGQILYLNLPDTRSYAALEGKTYETITDLFPLEFAEKLLALTPKVLANKRMQAIEEQLDFSGELRDLEIRIVSSGSDEVMAIVRDLSDRKKMERNLIRKNFELDSFIYRSSHDLKSPINSMMGLLEIMSMEDMPPEIRRYVDLMSQNVTRLDSFIQNLTDFSRINHFGTQFEKIEFKEMIKEVWEGLGFLGSIELVNKQVKQTGDYAWYGDNFHIKVILSNLISNAVKYQDHLKKEAVVSVKAHIESDAITLTVTDNGIGIPEEFRERMYDLFFRASSQSFGTGLGLYIVRNAVEKLNGQISLESEEGKGSSFRVILPNHQKQSPIQTESQQRVKNSV